MEGYVDNNLFTEYNPIIKDKTIVINFYGCNFNCPFCYAQQFHEFKSESIIEIREIKQELRRIYFNAKYVLFTGGEPTLQRIVLNNLARFSKSLELETFIHTNGSKPNVIKDLIENNLIDGVILDIKSPFESKIFEEITKSSNFFVSSNKIMDEVKKSIDVLRDNRDKVKIFVTTPILPGMNFDEETLDQIYEIIKYLRVPWILMRFKKKSDFGEVKDKVLLSYEKPNNEELKEIILKINKANIPFKII
ncbi:MAG: pyruvate formate lyase activating enzyme [Candidatus Woesearchaeota archaeon]|nr:pyruvate formate lyase activating enzyme [Candidatus Woesearchaeota archaeon]MDN5327829.1 pyruvate formate lyase activating enzyme [Candidatus Woesearchaeota archaeon]